MKSYSIGREETCNVIVNDPTQMVSRMHATLNVDGRKMTIVDNSTNGTYINGIRIQKGSPVPVTRKDVVSFAQVAELDWKCIPNDSGKALGIVAAVVAGCVLVGGVTAYFLTGDKVENGKQAQVEDVWKGFSSQVDSLKTVIPAIAADAKMVEDTLVAVKKILEDKDVSGKDTKKKLDELNKAIWQIEELMKGIDTGDLQKSLASVEQSLADKAAQTESRVQELSKKVNAASQALTKAKDLLKNAKESVNALPNKRKPGSSGRTPADSTNNKGNVPVV